MKKIAALLILAGLTLVLGVAGSFDAQLAAETSGSINTTAALIGLVLMLIGTMLIKRGEKE